MLLGRQARQAHSRGKSVGAPFHPPLVRVSVRYDAGKSPAGGCVPRREGFAIFPEFAGTLYRIRILPVGGNLEDFVDSGGGSRRF